MIKLPVTLKQYSNDELIIAYLFFYIHSQMGIALRQHLLDKNISTTGAATCLLVIDTMDELANTLQTEIKKRGLQKIIPVINQECYEKTLEISQISSENLTEMARANDDDLKNLLSNL